MTHTETMLHFDLEMRNEIAWRLLRGSEEDYTVRIIVPPPVTDEKYALIRDVAEWSGHLLLPRSWSYTIRVHRARGEVRVSVWVPPPRKVLGLIRE